MNTITLTVKGERPLSFAIQDQPRCEKDLLKYPEYNKWFWQIGLGAPVKAVVSNKNGLFNKSYSFEYTIKGNYMPFDTFLKVVERYKLYSECEHMNVSSNQGDFQFLYSFDSKEKAMQLCKDLDNICNIGSSAIYSQQYRKYMVKIEYYKVD